jgi:hypothetical protein
MVWPKLGGVNPARNLTSDRISQYVTLPADAKRLLFDVSVNSSEGCAKFYDVLNIEVNDTRLGAMDICNGIMPGRVSVDISAYAGQRVPISIFLTTDGSFGSEVQIDNVTISNSPTAVTMAQVLLTPAKLSMDITTLHK